MSQSRPRTVRTSREVADGQPDKAARMFALTVPGLAPLTRAELQRLTGADSSDAGHDGCSDVVLFELPRRSAVDPLELRTTEDVFVEVGRILRSEGDRPGWIASRIWRPARVERALSVWEHVRPLAKSMTYRVVVRVLQEKSFLRTELRRRMTRTIGEDRSKWRVADPAQVEMWLVEYTPGRLVAGLRLSTENMRQHHGRSEERHGALRPVVASAMVQLAGAPSGWLLDPCCGSGTILSEALAEGWYAHGLDSDSDAVRVSTRNAPQARVEHGDARNLQLPDAAVGACVSNLPFGDQYAVPGERSEWLAEVLGEMARVTRSDGRVIVLCPHVPRRSVPEELRLDGRTSVGLLGKTTTLWSYRRA